MTTVVCAKNRVVHIKSRFIPEGCSANQSEASILSAPQTVSVLDAVSHFSVAFVSAKLSLGPAAIVMIVVSGMNLFGRFLKGQFSAKPLSIQVLLTEYSVYVVNRQS